MRRHRLFDEIRGKSGHIAHTSLGLIRMQTLIVIDADREFGELGAQFFQPHDVEPVRFEPGLQLDDPHAIGAQPFHQQQVLVKIRIGDRDRQRNAVAALSAQKRMHRQTCQPPGQIQKGRFQRRLGFGAMGHRLACRRQDRRPMLQPLAYHQRADIPVKRGKRRLGAAGEHRPWRCLAPAFGAILGHQPQYHDIDGVFHAADAMIAARVDRQGQMPDIHRPDFLLQHVFALSAGRLQAKTAKAIASFPI